MKTKRPDSPVIGLWHLFIASVLLSLVIFTLRAFYVRFHVGLNDFWGVLFYSHNISWHGKESLFNGFFPIGYPLLIKFIPLESVVVASHFLNIFFAAFLISTTTVLVASRYGLAGAFLAVPAAMFHPHVFMYANIPGPYIGCAAFTSAAIFLLWRRILAGQEVKQTGADMAWAGLFLGLAALWRYNGAISSVAVIMFYYLAVGRSTGFAGGGGAGFDERNSTARSSARNRYALPAAFLLVCAIQIILNVISGHGAFETAQKFNVYRLVYDFNWWHPPPSIDMSLLDIVLAHPVTLIRNYIPFLLALTVYSLPAVCCVIISQDRAVTSYSLFAVGSILMYAVFAALGGSSRAPLVIMPIFASSLSICILEAYRRLSAAAFLSHRQRRLVITVLVCYVALYFGSWSYRDISGTRSLRSRNEQFRGVQQTLLEHGMTDPRQVFTDDFDLYMPEIPPYRPLHNGGWVKYSLHMFAERYPDMPIDSAHSFSEACRDRNILFLVLTESSSNLADFLYRLYRYDGRESQLLGDHISEIGPYKIFKVRSLPVSKPSGE